MDDDRLPPTAPAAARGWAAVFEGAERVAQAPLWQLSDDDVVGLLRAQAVALAQLEAGRLALIRDLEARGWASRVGATSTSVWLREALHIDHRAAAADVRAARALDPAGDVPPEPGGALLAPAYEPRLPALAATGRALAKGEISRPHSDAVLGAIADLPHRCDPTERAALHAKAEACLLEHCADRTPLEVRRLGRYLLSVVDPDGLLADDRDHATRDEAGLLKDHTGRGVFRAQLNPVATALLETLLEAGSAPRPVTDEGPDRRNPAQRRAAAFIDLIQLAANAVKDTTTHGGLVAQLVVTVPYASLVADDPRHRAVTETGTRLSGATARAMACDASLVAAVLGAASEPLDIGRASRVVPSGLRRALVLRDRHCAFPGCDRPPRWCDAHHVTHWAEGGPTCLSNLVLLCGHHHHNVIHAGEWTVHIGAAGRPVFTPPAWLDPSRRPRGPTDG